MIREDVQGCQDKPSCEDHPVMSVPCRGTRYAVFGVGGRSSRVKGSKEEGATSDVGRRGVRLNAERRLVRRSWCRPSACSLLLRARGPERTVCLLRRASRVEVAYCGGSSWNLAETEDPTPDLTLLLSDFDHEASARHAYSRLTSP